MRTAEEITTSAKPMFDRFSNGLKVVGSGNTAGLVGMVAAPNTIKEEHVHTVLLLKPSAIIFAIGIFLFAGFMKRALILALASTFLFFLGFVTAFTALVRY